MLLPCMQPSTGARFLVERADLLVAQATNNDTTIEKTKKLSKSIFFGCARFVLCGVLGAVPLPRRKYFIENGVPSLTYCQLRPAAV